MNKSNKPTERRDERNLARLGIISIQTWVDSSITKVTAEFNIEGRLYRVECHATNGRPHGIDTDVILAIQTLYVRSGCPEHGWIHTTTYELRDLAGLPDNGKSHARLRDSLKRLATCTFFVSEGSYDQVGRKRWDTDTMRYIERVRFRETDDTTDLPGLDETSTISLRLGEQLADSIREGYTQVLDGKLLLQLEQPPARALYRLLEAHRKQPDGSRLLKLTVNLEDWRQACGISSDRPEIIRRGLAPAHEELIAVKYLQQVDVEGRGKKQTFTYHFQTEGAPDPALIELLISEGFSRGAAADVVRVHEPRIEEGVTFARARRAAGYQIKNKPGFIADYLRNPEKYRLCWQIPQKFSFPASVKLPECLRILDHDVFGVALEV